MILFDVNVLVSAFREESPVHTEVLAWLRREIEGRAAFGFSDLAASGFLRVITNPRAFSRPTPVAVALSFVDWMRLRDNCTIIRPGPRHWEIFTGLCQEVEAKGNLIPDTYFAALAIEHGCEWITFDRDYARFPGLKWRHPLKPGRR